MSYTEIFKIDKAGDVYNVYDIKNSWRGAIKIWAILEKKYLPPYEPEWAKYMQMDTKVGRFCDFTNKEALQEIWDLFKNKQVSLTDKIVLGTTFDHVIVFKKDFQAVITAFENFEGETSLPEQAHILKALQDSSSCIGVAWNQTSVNAGAWRINSPETGESVCYNIFKQNNHWDLFADLHI